MTRKIVKRSSIRNWVETYLDMVMVDGSNEILTTEIHDKELRKIHKTRSIQSMPRAQLRGVLLHHDNAKPHTSTQTLDFLANSGVQLVTHPSYSLDLAPCNFFISKS
ncbi:hypothetical protein LAZ67_17001456 [Cordylochernes scorpioides]|uniref:Transposase n=1 Tax=Cordylochernes scorpioides TaxID=51811 RepID=A0ABY6LEA9_9ARAC|nr:hypothetical protein LAZ67_17001456 [Cordylochernes scorpioides]